ncbi:unnamed protein product [Strongylus vulgaris]|uniref:Uncharacterized protein n=1 Tax=Strongylus vulgaris TaxID=40348 RepID=A0A3P7ILB7_STRVU|nr:unnamed protein product [Strongylus vulgaris]
MIGYGKGMEGKGMLKLRINVKMDEWDYLTRLHIPYLSGTVPLTVASQWVKETAFRK